MHQKGKKIIISVIVPTHNRADILVMCLKSLKTQSLPPDLFEVIVSDDGSNDNIQAHIQGFLDDTSFNCVYLRQEKAGANPARNNAIKHSRGEILLLINDDILASAKMLEEHFNTHKKYPGESDSVLGKVTIYPSIDNSFFTTLHLDASFDLWKGMEFLDWKAFYTCNISVKKSFLDKYGYFDTGLNWHEDLELSERLSHHNLRVIYNPAALGYHNHNLDEGQFLNIAKKEGKALAIWYKKSPHLKETLASIGFYPGLPFYKRIKYIFADIIMNSYSIPVFLPLARSLQTKHPRQALALYRKIFQSIKRKSIRDELQKES
ncbi:MAG: glycosyltransferase family 2 protein [Candidatus Aureabacteria bacterium]|nr:glycosyltransferase family 2 protein [Candidatus Auribacterota bacterium]